MDRADVQGQELCHQESGFEKAANHPSRFQASMYLERWAYQAEIVVIFEKY